MYAQDEPVHGYYPLCKREEGSGNIAIPVFAYVWNVDMTNRIIVECGLACD